MRKKQNPKYRNENPPLATAGKSRGGFALVLALSLMGFMVLLVVTLAGVVQMQMRMGRQNLANARAKSAAKFAAYQALGNVQAALGPDTRITANAKIFDYELNREIARLDAGNYHWWEDPMGIDREEADTVESSDDNALSQNRHWVGVWDSRMGHVPGGKRPGGIVSRHQLRSQPRANYAERTVKSALTWLVSGNGVAGEEEIMSSGESKAVKFFPTRNLERGSFVRAATANSSSDAQGNHESKRDVLAPLVPLGLDRRASTGFAGATSRQTRIAWWVSDENQKASLNAIAPLDFLTHAKSVKFRVQSLPFYSGAQGLTLGADGERLYNLDINEDDGGEGSPFNIARSASDIKDFDALKTDGVPAEVLPSRVLFHSATADSKGLLVNVRHGGLKKDLSLGLIRTDRGNEPDDVTDTPTDEIPSYFPRPYGVAGFFTKTTAYPLIYCRGDQWRRDRRQNKPELSDINYDGGKRYSGHMFGPQQYDRENEVARFRQMSAVAGSKEFSSLYGDENIWKDPGGPLWDQLRSYYNTRSPDFAKDSDIEDRVQTDDRFGVKPVVKRFQVFYVPTFVNYGGQKYGIRLHIIPLMVLWNPYDTKIGGDSYYAIRVMGQNYMQFQHPIGTFRFAVGYEATSNVFQCIRDLRTERLPAFMANTGSGDEYIYNNNNNSDRLVKRFCFVFTNYNTTGSNGSYYTNGSNHSFDPYAGNGEQNATNNNLNRVRSKYNGFYIVGNSGASSSGGYQAYGWNALPLGYGGLAPSYFTKNGDSLVDVDYDFNNATGGVNTSGRSLQGTNQDGVNTNVQSANETYRYIVQENNLVPSVDKAFDYKFSNERSAAITSRCLRRLAKIPLFLNNLYVSVDHGRNLPGLDRNNAVFYPQMPIDQTDVNLNDPSIVRTCTQGSSSYFMGGHALHFLAYDKTGIAPGRAKVFAMERIVNYVGDPTSARDTDGYTDVRGGNGPNGFIEGEVTRNLYTAKHCMMKPLGEGGALGGCFYLDVPHPEVEHEAKYNQQNPNHPYDQYVFSNSYGQYDNIYILFDLNDLRNSQARDLQGQQPPSDIRRYYIDMQEVTGFAGFSLQHGDIFHTPFGMGLSATPMGYGVFGGNLFTKLANDLYGVFLTGSVFNGNDNRFAGKYQDLNLDIWIFKRDGMTFTNLNPFGRSSNMTHNSFYPDGAPMLVSISGRRFFGGDALQSFPDPTLMREYTLTNTGSRTGEINNNYATQGLVGKDFQAGYSNLGAMVSLKPITYYDKFARNNYMFFGSGNDDPGINFEKTPKGEGWEAYLEKYKQNVVNPQDNPKAKFYNNSRFYINWMPINPRRHTANWWRFESGRPNAGNSGSMSDRVGDLPPHAIQGSQMTVIENSSRRAGNYMDKLNGICRMQGTVPMGYLFMQPYGFSEESRRAGTAEPFVNRRLFVNGTLLATHWMPDFDSISMSGGDNDEKRFAWQFGMLTKNIIATNEFYSEQDVGLGGQQTLDIEVFGPSDDEPYIGLSPSNGSVEIASHHILRRTEVVSNPANLSGSNLNFGVGKGEAGGDWREGGGIDYFLETSRDGYHPWAAAYGLSVPENLNASLPIGNSLCPSRIVPERSFQITWLDGSCEINSYHNTSFEYGRFNSQRENNWVEDKSVVYDYSWHLNDVLWDEYFFSTLPYRGDEEETAYDDGNDGAYPQNPRLRYAPGAERLSMGNMDYDREESDRQFDENASRFWVDGAFNVNSTDVDAWKAVLSTYFGQTVESYTEEDNEDGERAPFLRYQAPLRAKAVTSENADMSNESDLMAGYRALDAAEIEELACSIVEHVKDRGPFYSMSEFVNRMVSNESAEERYMDSEQENLLDYSHQVRPADRQNMEAEILSGGRSFRADHMQKGVLQAAIDSTSINSAFHNDYIVHELNNISDLVKDTDYLRNYTNPRRCWENWRGAIGPQATGAPAYLMQQDILARLGSFLTVRSDTFKVRAYGEVRNPVSGVVEGRAWCEMTVQRLPEYVDSRANRPWDVYGRMKELGYQDAANQGGLSEYNEVVTDEEDGALNPVNRTLGRRFKVVGFKWLNEKEI